MNPFVFYDIKFWKFISHMLSIHDYIITIQCSSDGEMLNDGVPKVPSSSPH